MYDALGSIPEWFFLLGLTLFGLLFGSFANVVIWRFPRKESLSTPPSHCPKCNTPIAWRDNIPLVSWALLRARCRSCGVHIPARYPLVEALSGALWLSAGLLFGATIKCGFGVAFLYLLMILSFIDWDTMRLPNPLVALLAAIGFIGAVFAQLSAIEATPLISASGALSQPLVAALAGSILAMAISLGIAALYSAVRRASGFGMGDVKLLGAMGPFLGLYVLMALFFGSLIGAIYGIAAMRSSGKTLRTKVPFGPFLAIGGVIALWFGPALWSWYAGIAFGSV